MDKSLRAALALGERFRCVVFPQLREILLLPVPCSIAMELPFVLGIEYLWEAELIDTASRVEAALRLAHEELEPVAPDVVDVASVNSHRIIVASTSPPLEAGVFLAPPMQTILPFVVILLAAARCTEAELLLWLLNDGLRLLTLAIDDVCGFFHH